jgi:hypothetical protein
VGRVALRPTEEGYCRDGEFVVDEEAIFPEPENRRLGGQLGAQTPDPAGVTQRDSQFWQGKLGSGHAFLDDNNGFLAYSPL